MAPTRRANEVDEERTLKARLVWLLLVVIVPILVTVMIIAVALQIVGVPVWSTVLNYTGLGVKPKTTINPVAVIQRQLSATKSRNTALSEQASSLQSQLSQERATEQQLHAQIKQLQTQLSNRVSVRDRAKKEATLLATMDATQAAQVLSKMTLSEGAQVIAQMQNTNASDILAAMSPDLASRLVNLSSQVAGSVNASGQ